MTFLNLKTDSKMESSINDIKEQNNIYNDLNAPHIPLQNQN